MKPGDTEYFSDSGKQNMDALLECAREYANKKNIRSAVVASSTDETGARVPRSLKKST